MLHDSTASVLSHLNSLLNCSRNACTGPLYNLLANARIHLHCCTAVFRLGLIVAPHGFVESTLGIEKNTASRHLAPMKILAMRFLRRFELRKIAGNKRWNGK
jgi:predicted component of type VI protein secretion system